MYLHLSPGSVSLFTTLGIYVNGPNDYRRWMYIWQTFFHTLAAICAWKVYQGWKRHGGRNYTPPAVGPAAGVSS